jgi:methylated-DNA-[protein]-cysteine S-methyltransferase
VSAPVHYGSRRTAFGRLWAALGDDGVLLVAIGGAPVGTLAGDVRRRKDVRLLHAPEGVSKLLDDLEGYLSGRRVALARWTLDPAGMSPFRMEVYAATRAVPYGTRVAGPRHAHAVGAALAANPFRLLVPDHRVILARGATGESRLGRGLKARLLALEGGQQDMAWNPREGVRP